MRKTDGLAVFTFSHMFHKLNTPDGNPRALRVAAVSILIVLVSAIVPFAGAQEPPQTPPPAPALLPPAPATPIDPARPIERSERLDALRNIRSRAQNQGDGAERPSATPTDRDRATQGLQRESGRRMGTTSTESLRERMGERREARRAEMETRRDERRETLRDAARARVHAFMERMLRRFDAAIQRLRNLADRVGSRIEKLEMQRHAGWDLTNAKELLATARVEIDAAAATLVAIRANLEAAVAEDDPRAAFEAIHEAIGEAKDAVRKAHRALVEAIVAIRASSGRGADGSGAATTTGN